MKVYVSIGANLGEREKSLKEGLDGLCKSAGLLITKSALYETEPVGFESKDLFLNQVAIINTDLNPFEFVSLIRKIETSMGRIRNENRYISRIIDIDILFYEDLIMDTPGLVIPHPRMHERRFVLEPLCDIAPDFIHPVLQKSIKELLSDLKDGGKVVKVKL